MRRNGGSGLPGFLREFLADRALIAWGLITLIVLAPAAGWGIPHATSADVARGWEVDAISGLGVLSELANLSGPGRADWYVAYPLAHYLLLGVVYIPYIAFATLTGMLSNPGGAYPYGFTDPVRALVVLNAIGHGVTVLMGCITIMAVFALARRIFGVKAAMLSAALALCCAPFMFYARTGNLDVPALCWTMLALVVLERAWSDGLTWGRAIACGAFAALAVATKDQSYGMLFVPLGLLLVRSLRAAPPEPFGSRAKFPLAVVASGIVMLLVAGGVIIRPDRFVRHIQYVAGFRETFTNVVHGNSLTVVREPTVAGRLLLLGDLLRASATAIGWPVVVAGVAGFAVLWRSTTAIRWMFAALAGFFVLVLMPIGHMQYRYALAPAMLFAISAAGLLGSLAKRPVVFGALAVVLVAPALAGGAEVTHAMLVDARGAASAWLSERAIPGDVVGYFGRPHQLPYIPAGVRTEPLDDTGNPRERLLQVRPRWIVVAPDYFADSLRERSTFLPPDLYEELRAGSLGWTLVERFESRGLLRRPLPYLPYVNPVVQAYEREP